jgi:hypothetical protein
LLNVLSRDHPRGSDVEQLRKFIELCHHWGMLAKEELERPKQSKGYSPRVGAQRHARVEAAAYNWLDQQIAIAEAA